MKRFLGLFYVLLLFLIVACKKDTEVLPVVPIIPGQPVDTTKPYIPTPYFVKLPLGLTEFPYSIDNPLTVEGVELGRKLFHDKMLSLDETQSCASCHNQLNGFTDNGNQFSTGITGAVGTRNSMPLFNLAWVEKFAKTTNRFFWDGGSISLEHQSLDPITNPIEMAESLLNVLSKLQQDSVYPSLFKKAFGTDSITTKLLSQAIAQFERTIVSGSTRFDKYRLFLQPAYLTAQELRGLALFNTEEKADCFHCHNVSGSYSTDFLFHNNGHQSTDLGLARITNNAEDNGKFRTPTLRNLQLTAPYMHDGRLKTLEEVVEFYNSGAIRNFPADPFITKHPNGLQLTSEEKADLVAFLKCMTDSTLITNPDYK
jgi:cytochrome c peroxidase